MLGDSVVSLDSAFLIDLLRESPAALRRAERFSGESRGVTPPAATEVLFGAHRFGKRAVDAAEGLIASLDWLEFDRESAHLAGRIEAELADRGSPLGSADLFIAAITLRHGHSLLTRDRDFARVPGLQVETY